MVRGFEGGSARFAAAMILASMTVAGLAAPAEANLAVAGYNLFANGDAGGASWTAPVSNTNHYLRGVAYGGGTWVAVGQSGAILTSPNARQWTPQTSGTTMTFNDVTYATLTNGNTLFVAVGPYNTAFLQTVWTSPNGNTWTQNPTPLTYNFALQSVTHGRPGGQDRFVAVGASGMAVTSPDGTLWTPQATVSPTTSTAAPYLYGVTYGEPSGNPLYVAVGSGGSILTSADGFTWFQQVSGTTQTLMSVAWGGNQFVAVGGSGTILTSPNGLAWTPRSAGTMYTTTLQGVEYGGGRWVALSNMMYPNSTSASAYLITSTDAIQWTSRPATTYYWYGPQAIGYGNGMFAAVGNYGSAIYSRDGLDWHMGQAMAGYYPYLHAMASSGNEWVAATFYGMLTSKDRDEWTVRYTGTGWSSYFYTVGYGAGQYVASGWGGIYTSQDAGKSWTKTGTMSGQAYGVAHGPGKWVLVGYPASTAMVSSDGQTWSSVNTGSSAYYLYDVKWGGGQFVAVGYGGTILTSPDGNTWTARTSGTGMYLMGVAYDSAADPKWVAVGGAGVVVTSNDGVTWTPGSTGLGSYMYDIARDGGNWVVTTGSASVLRSPDASAGSWTGAALPMAAGAWGYGYTVESDRQPPLECGPVTQIVGLNTPAKVYGNGGLWPYTWTAPGSDITGSPSGAMVSPKYASEANYTVTIRDSSSPPQTATCQVQAMLNPPPPPPDPSQACGYQVVTTKDDPSLYQWTEIAPAQGGTGTPITAMNWYYEKYSITPAPTFDFPFCGSKYKTFELTTAGLICLTNTGANNAIGYYWSTYPYCGYFYGYGGLPNPWGFNKPAVLGQQYLYNPYYCWSGQYASPGCGVFYQVQGTAPNRVLIYEYSNMPMGYTTSSPPQSFQIKLFESGCIEVHFKSTEDNPSYPWYYAVSGYESSSTAYQHFYEQSYADWQHKVEAWQACPFGARKDAYVFNEDQPARNLDVTANDNTGGNPVTVTAWTMPKKGQLTFDATTKLFSYKPDKDQNGKDDFTYTIRSGTMVSTGTVDLTINPVNDPPAFAGVDTTYIVSPADGKQAIPGWASDLRAGWPTSTDETGQAITFKVSSNTNAGIFLGDPEVLRSGTATSLLPSVPPTIGDFGILRFAPSGNTGTARVCFVPVDDGGTATVKNTWNEPATGVDTGDEQCVTIVENAAPIAYFEPGSAGAMPLAGMTFNPCPAPPPKCTYDPDGEIVARLWEFGDGVTSAFEWPTHRYATSGVYKVRLTVWDEHGAVTTYERDVVVEVPDSGAPEAPRAPPALVADAGPDIVASEGTPVQLVGKAIGGSEATRFTWLQVSGPTAMPSDASVYAPVLTAPRLPTMEPVDLVYALRVADGAVQSEPDYVVVHVVSANGLPVADAGDILRATPGGSTRLDGSRSMDPDGEDLTYRWEQVLRPGDTAVRLEGATSATPTFTAPAQPGQLAFRLEVSDGRAMAADEVLVEVLPTDVADGAVAARGRDVPAAATPGAEASAPTAFWPWMPLAGAAMLLLAALVSVAILRRNRKA